jgi:DNA recombination protein RmuC
LTLLIASFVGIVFALGVGLWLGGRETSAARSEARAARDEANQTGIRLARATAELEAERSRTADAQRLLAETDTRMREAFQSLSLDVLKLSGQQFLDLAGARFGELHVQAQADLLAREKAVENLVTPIAETLGKVEGRLKEVEDRGQVSHVELKTLVTELSLGNQRLLAETSSLVKALRQPQVRGRWGELQLRRVVELAGMLDHCDFVEQVSTEDGRLRPDLIVRLPGEKRIIVDAKAPLDAYLQAAEATDEDSRERCLQAHARQVRDHITKLGAKAYWDQFEDTPELVFLFLPGEAFYVTALQQDASLLEHGVESKVIPASPVTLIALLRAVHYEWRQERLAENAREISDLGRQLYDRMRVLGGHLAKIGANLSRAVDAYNDSVGSLERSVLPSARRFRELGASSGQEIEVLEPIEVATRRLQAEELLPGDVTDGEEPPRLSAP